MHVHLLYPVSIVGLMIILKIYIAGIESVDPSSCKEDQGRLSWYYPISS